MAFLVAGTAKTCEADARAVMIVRVSFMLVDTWCSQKEHVVNHLLLIALGASGAGLIQHSHILSYKSLPVLLSPPSELH